MKKKFLNLFILANLFAASSFAQSPRTPVMIDDDEAKDMGIESQEDIEKAMNKRGVELDLEAKRKASWKRKTFFRLSYTNTDMWADPADYNDKFFTSNGLKQEDFMMGDELMLDGNNAENKFYSYKSKLSASMMWGRNISLHKKPIAHTVQFALDYTWIDLNYSQYEVAYTKDGNKFDSSERFDMYNEDGEREGSYYYTPWGLEKHEVNYGMSLGPSITVAPCGILRSSARNLHLQAYYHVGYSASFILTTGKNKNLEMNNREFSSIGLWGHGMNTSWGLNLTWKAIGLGFEKRQGTFNYYTSVDTDSYGDVKYKFQYKNSRLYVTFNF